MSKKMTGTICATILIVSCAICSILYAIMDSSKPWWLIVFAGGVVSAIIAMISNYKREENKDKKHMLLISTICASISMLSVFIFLTVYILTKYSNSWIIVFIGGIISGIIYMIDNAKKDK